MLDVLVPEVGLQRTGVVAGVGQGVAASMAQHVQMDRERQLGPQSDARKQGVKGLGRQRSTALG